MRPGSPESNRSRRRSREAGKGAALLQNAWTRTLSCLRRFGRRRARATVVFALLGLAASGSVGLLTGPPVPRVHDEFAYLLASDTFANGKWTNPPHPLWRHFETFHVLQQPTYSSKYPPGQGAILALGQAMVGHPAAGVWLSIGLATGAIAWMLLVWLPPAWGVMGALFFTAQVSWVSYWAQSYWGGAVAALGGALALGAVRALWKRPKLGHGLVLGLGLGILAASRPFESAIVGVFLAGLLGLRLWRTDPPGREFLIRRGVLPAMLVTGASLAGLAYHNSQVTGSALHMPYQVYEQQYAAVPTFLFQKPGPKRTYAHPEFDAFWNDWARGRHEAQRRPRTFTTSAAVKLSRQLFFFLGPGLFALVALPKVLARRWIAYALLILGATAGATLFTKQGYPHYVAPATGAFYLVLGACLTSLHRSARQARRPDLSLVVVLALLGYLPFAVSNYVATQPKPHAFAQQRDAFLRLLESKPGKDLVIVRYLENHNVLEEWVYNEADLDGSEVVWARSVGSREDRNLIEYFADRRIWILTVGDRARLEPLGKRVSGSAPAPWSMEEGSLP